MSAGRDPERWIADRMRHIESSGIRKVFRTGPQPEGPRQPQHRPARLRRARADQGRRPRRHRPRRQRLHRHAGHRRVAPSFSPTFTPAIATHERELFITSGTSGGLVLALLLHRQPRRRGDRLRPLLRHVPAPRHAGRRHDGLRRTPTPTSASTWTASRAALTPRTKAILLNSPANPTGRVYSREQVRDLARTGPRERGVLLISDEIYRAFCYDSPFASPAEFNPDVLVIDGFSKSLRHDRLAPRLRPRPAAVDRGNDQAPTVHVRLRPSIVQHAGVAALGLLTYPAFVADYRRKRDRIYDGLKDRYEVVRSRKAPSTSSQGAARHGYASSWQRPSATNCWCIPGSTL